MYFAGFVIFIALLIISTSLSGSMAFFVDLPSMLIILAFSLPMLMASGLFPDFIRAFKIMGRKVNVWSMIELNRTEIALRLAIKLLLSSGLLGCIIGIVSMLSTTGGMRNLGPNIAVSLLTVLYSILIVFILLPLQAKVKSMILTMEKEYIDEETAR